MYTIKSVSEEGEYYLVNHWNKFKAIWQQKEKRTANRIFKDEKTAKASLTKLLKVMPEYGADKLMMVQVNPDGVMEDLYEIPIKIVRKDWMVYRVLIDGKCAKRG